MFADLAILNFKKIIYFEHRKLYVARCLHRVRSTLNRLFSYVQNNKDVNINNYLLSKEPIVINNTENNTQLKVNIPNTAETKDGRQSTDGTVLFKEAAKDTDIAIQPLADESVKALIKINSAEAPTSFNFPVTIPEGGGLMLLDDGSVLVLNNQDNPLSTIDKPWAKDSNLVAVPTHFEVDPTGTKLTQVVDYKTGNYAFPIAADPWYKPWTWGPINKVVNGIKKVANNPESRKMMINLLVCVGEVVAMVLIGAATNVISMGSLTPAVIGVVILQLGCLAKALYL